MRTYDKYYYDRILFVQRTIHAAKRELRKTLGSTVGHLVTRRSQPFDRGSLQHILHTRHY